MKKNGLLSFALLVTLSLFAFPQLARAQHLPVVRAVLFYSPTCPHCHQVIEEVLPLLFHQYGEQLDIIGIDISAAEGHELYQAAILLLGIPEERWGVPTLIIGETVLVGSLEIPEEFPLLIESYLAQGGVDWPDIPGLNELLIPTSQPENTPVATPTTTAGNTGLLEVGSEPDTTPVSSELEPIGKISTTWQDRFFNDLTGNSLSVFVLVAMFGTIIWTGVKLTRQEDKEQINWHPWLVLALGFIGMGIAGYLSFVEIKQVTAVCGPVGDCNTVQQSEYSRLFGILPIGILGLLGYVAIIIAWLLANYLKGRGARLAALACFAMAALGTLFSAYLTFLEPFVIGATCIWCLSSAVLMTVLMVFFLGPAKAALRQSG